MFELQRACVCTSGLHDVDVPTLDRSMQLQYIYRPAGLGHLHWQTIATHAAHVRIRTYRCIYMHMYAYAYAYAYMRAFAFDSISKYVRDIIKRTMHPIRDRAVEY